MKNNARLCIDDANGKFLGVCAGIANFVGIEIWMIRAAFIASLFFAGWFMVPAYFIAWFFMDEEKGSSPRQHVEALKTKSKGRIARQIEHFRHVDYKKKLYRNKKDGKFLGVCAGLADYLEVDVSLVRIVVVLTSLIPGSFVPLAYFIAFFILDKKPKNRFQEKNPAYEKIQETLDESKVFSRSSFKSCSRKFSGLHERLSRIEAYVTSNRFKLDREFRNI